MSLKKALKKARKGLAAGAPLTFGPLVLPGSKPQDNPTVPNAPSDPLFEQYIQNKNRNLPSKLHAQSATDAVGEYAAFKRTLDAIGDVNTDPNVQRLLKQYQDAFVSADHKEIGDLKAQLEQYADTARTLKEQARLKQEGRTNLLNTLQGVQDDPNTPENEAQAGTIQTAFQLAQPVLQQELARLGILHGGALTQNSEQVAKELELNRQNQVSAYDLGQLAQAQGINVDSLNSILGLRNQQRAQQLALSLGQQQSQALQAAARAQAKAQQQAAMWNFGGNMIGGYMGGAGVSAAGKTGSIWG